VAFEPVEVRLGLVLKPLYRGTHPKGAIDATAGERRSVLQRAHGPEDERKRRNTGTSSHSCPCSVT
jgi:hypothetical protein